VGRLDGRVAAITGAGRGIGAATARRFADEGAAVVLNDLDADPLEAVCGEIIGLRGRVRSIPGDASDPAVAEAIASEALGAFGGLDILVCCAGITADAAFHALDDAAWQDVDRSCWRATRATVRACVDIMRAAATEELARDGRVAHQRKIVMTAAATFLTGSPGQANLTAAAGAVVGLTRTLARELGGFGINVNTVLPGFIDTRLTARQPAEGGLGVAEPVRQMTKAMTALGRYGSPEDVAAVNLFLASADADFVTGVTIDVTGGQ